MGFALLVLIQSNAGSRRAVLSKSTADYYFSIPADDDFSSLSAASSTMSARARSVAPCDNFSDVVPGLGNGLRSVPHALEVRLELGGGGSVVDHDQVVVRSPLVLKFAEPVRRT
jgi:hypothetical protein